ncbi:MAG: endonuclease/exonuclease/phosphatase family protein, partial [Aeromonas sp.]
KRGADIAALIQSQSADVIGVNETWLKEGMQDHEFIPRCYMVFRKDRPEKANPKKKTEMDKGKGRGGGVLLAVRPHLQPKRVIEFDNPNSPSTEIVWVKISAANMTFLIGSAYRAPNLDADQNKNFLQALNQVALKIHEYDGLILMGDFNLDVNWAPEMPIAGRAPAADFLSDFSGMGLTQLIKGPTRTTDQSAKTIDLLLTDVPEIFSGAEVVAGVSDHDALVAYLSLKVVRPMRPPKTVFNFNRANWDELENDLARHLPQEFPNLEINSAWELWKAKFFECLHRNVPTKKIKQKAKSLPWLDNSLRKMMTNRDKLFSKWHKLRTDTARELFAKARNATQRALRAAKDQFMWKLGTGPQGSKFFWSYINERSKVPINNTAFVEGGKTYSQPKEVA